MKPEQDCTQSGARPILAFSHITKNAGTSIVRLLRNYFGNSHLDVFSESRIYGNDDLRRDLKHFPRTRSIAGHHLFPTMEFDSDLPELWWFTILRDPVRRYLSHYQHVLEKTSMNMTLEQWVEREAYWNMQTKMLGSGGNADRAIQIITDRMAFAGTVERFRESVLCIERLAELPTFSRGAIPKANTARSSELKRMIIEEADAYRDIIEQANAEDLKVYRFVSEEYLPGIVSSLESRGFSIFLAQEENIVPVRNTPNLLRAFLVRNFRYRFISGYWKEKFIKRLRAFLSRFRKKISI